jgi:hypothetical protein
MIIRRALFLVALAIFSFLFYNNGYAQSDIEPRGAFLRSLAIPGWGHYYADNDNWTRGAVHLGVDAVLIASYVGLRVRSSNLENQFVTLASLRAGVDITDRNRTFQLALADFNTLGEYNDFQLRSRNWNRLIDATPENEWNWVNEKDRERYNELRANRETAKNQIPAVAALLVVNRVLSAVNAYTRARTMASVPEIVVSPLLPGKDAGIITTIRFRY